MAYNPFPKPIGLPLDASDLNSLVADNVAEGYYVEYKSDFPTNAKIGRSLASLANTFGGWYIVGVITDSNNVAVSVTGYDLANTPDAISKVREVAKAHIDPLPLFSSQVVTMGAGKPF